MKFEHTLSLNEFIAAINSSAELPAAATSHSDIVPVTTFSRADLWQSLFQRAEHPQPFLPGLQECKVIARSDGRMDRCLDFGGVMVHDIVTWDDEQWLRFDIVPADHHPSGSLTITLTEPIAGEFFLRFTYETKADHAQAAADDADYCDYVKSAYHHSDLDCMRIIAHALVHHAQPDSPPPSLGDC